MNFFSRFIGTFFDPGRTFKAIAERPIWVDALVVVLIAVSLYTYLVLPVGQRESLQMMQDNGAKLKEKLGEARYEAALGRIKNQNRALTSFLITPLTFLVGLLFSALIVLGMGRIVSTQGHYLQVFAALIHANFVDKVLGNALRYFLVSSRNSVFQTTTALPVFLPRLEITSTAYIVLNQVDFFQLWLFGLFGLGLAAAFKISLKKALVISYAFWVIKSLPTIIFTIMQMRLFQ
jgi:hypothetical protein